jgi:flagellar basal-body rod protein FlgB
VNIEASLGVLEHGLRVSMLREKAIQANLANASTPGYQRVEVKFESLLAGDGAAPFLETQPEVVRDASPGRPDGNNVEFDQEYAAMERNRIYYEALVEVASLRIQGLRQAIQSR